MSLSAFRDRLCLKDLPFLEGLKHTQLFPGLLSDLACHPGVLSPQVSPDQAKVSQRSPLRRQLIQGFESAGFFRFCSQVNEGLRERAFKPERAKV
jgi:hypothetical protein